MNVLIDTLPTAVEIDGKEYKLNADFRTGIKIMTAFEDNELTDFEKQSVMLELLYKEIPPNIKKAQEMAVKFLNCGEVSKADSDSEQDSGRLYSFTQDAKYILSAVKQTFGVDLETSDMHWWKFSYMFLDLDENCFFCKLIYLRKQKTRGKLTKEEKEWYYSIREIVDLPKSYTTEEQQLINDFMAKLAQ